VLLLEIISLGIELSYEDTIEKIGLFPELYIRSTAKNILIEISKIVDSNEDPSVAKSATNTTEGKKNQSRAAVSVGKVGATSSFKPISIRQKLFNTLVLTSDLFLKKNLFISLLYISPRSDSLSRYN